MSVRRAAPLLAGLFLASLALRPQLVGIGPLLPSMQDDLDVPHAVAGLLSTILVLCMGIFAPPAFHVAQRLGRRHAIALSLGARRGLRGHVHDLLRRQRVAAGLLLLGISSLLSRERLRRHAALEPSAALVER